VTDDTAAGPSGPPRRAAACARTAGARERILQAMILAPRRFSTRPAACIHPASWDGGAKTA